MKNLILIIILNISFTQLNAQYYTNGELPRILSTGFAYKKAFEADTFDARFMIKYQLDALKMAKEIEDNFAELEKFCKNSGFPIAKFQYNKANMLNPSEPIIIDAKNLSNKEVKELNDFIKKNFSRYSELRIARKAMNTSKYKPYTLEAMQEIKKQIDNLAVKTAKQNGETLGKLFRITYQAPISKNYLIQIANSNSHAGHDHSNAYQNYEELDLELEASLNAEYIYRLEDAQSDQKISAIGFQVIENASIPIEQYSVYFMLSEIPKDPANSDNKIDIYKKELNQLFSKFKQLKIDSSYSSFDPKAPKGPTPEIKYYTYYKAKVTHTELAKFINELKLKSYVRNITSVSEENRSEAEILKTAEPEIAKRVSGFKNDMISMIETVNNIKLKRVIRYSVRPIINMGKSKDIDGYVEMHNLSFAEAYEYEFETN
ncbi:MAG: hypothetical protein MUE53_03820 [Chitinophagales bacterium]|jgi:hypothetical protein|nr:hypothetical protein [Chitinophagales bacterium]